MSLSPAPEPSSEPTKLSTSSRGRGRGRGGLGKYLRARGRGRGYGRPAEFSKRHLLEGEEPEEEDEEAKAERLRKYSRRQLTSNADRYAEPEPELGSDGEPIEEPEIDLSRFLEKQQLSELGPAATIAPSVDDDDDVDHSLAHISTKAIVPNQGSRKGKMEQVAWNAELEEMSREKAIADAHRDLKLRLRAKKDQLRQMPPVDARERKAGKCDVSVRPLLLRKISETIVDAPALPVLDGSQPRPKDAKQDMQDFLDDLLG